MKKKFAEEENEWVNVHNDEEMISLGIRPPHWTQPDWSKSEKEKALLKKLHTKNDMKYSGKRTNLSLSHTCYDKLIVTIEKHNGDTNNVISHKCFEYEIPSVLCRLDWLKYYFNGRTYYRAI